MPRYRIPNHPSFENLLSKEDLYLLVACGSVARGEICTDTRTGNSHKVGELIGGMTPPRTGDAKLRIQRPSFQEIRADGPAEDDPEEDFSSEEEVVDDGDYTASGERIYYHGHPSWWAFTKALFLFTLLGIAAGLSSAFGSTFLLIGVALALITLVSVALFRFSCDFWVTDERVEMVWGVFGRSSKEVRICDIRSIDVHQKGLAGMIGLGSVDFSSSANSGVEVQFKNIRRAHEVKELVRSLQKDKKE
jgi:membrane protein YdbS with pleckstrin-like domain